MRHLLLLLASLATLPCMAQDWNVPLDHVFFRLPAKTYSNLLSSKVLKNSSSFYVDMERDNNDYQAHYLNGLQAYVEIFDSSKADKMKYVGDGIVGLGFRNEDFETFDALQKKLIKGNPPCKIDLFTFEKSRFIHCRVNHLTLMIHSFSPGNGIKVTRLSSAEYLRKERKITQVPVANDAIETVLTLNSPQVQSLSTVLKVLGWNSSGLQSWCRNEQCIRVVEDPELKEPILVSVTFSTTTPIEENHRFDTFSIHSIAPKKLLMSLDPDRK